MSGDGGDEGVFVDNAGNVGIGVVSPTEKLDVNGNIKGSGVCIGTDCKTSWPSGTASWGSVCNPAAVGACSSCCGPGTVPCGYMGRQVTISGTTICLVTASSQGSCGALACDGGVSCCPWCPFFYSWDGQKYVKDTTFIYKLDGPEKEDIQLRELTHLGLTGTIKAKIVEEEPETSYIDMVKILVVDRQGDSKKEYELNPVYSSRDLEKILYSDDQYLVTNQGDEISLEFEPAPALPDGWTRQVFIKAEGYYILK